MSVLGTLLLAVAGEPVLTTAAEGFGPGDPLEVGRPFELVCVVEHDAGTRPRLDPVELDEVEPWVCFGAERGTTAPAATPGRELTRLSWTLACLEPGGPELPWLSFELEVDGRPRTFVVDHGPVEAAGVLAEVEDAPRPLRGFRTLPEPEAAASPWLVWGLALFAGLLLLAAALGVPLARRALRRRAPPTGPNGLARLDALAAADLSPRARHFELSRIVREELDAVAGPLGVEGAAGAADARRGLTDEEWLAALEGDARVPAGAKEAAAAALGACASVKYAGGAPTSWALEETLGQARRALEEATA